MQGIKKIFFERVTVKNFLSIGEEPVVIDFTEGLHLLTGRNIDKPERANAVGKSAAIESIYFAIFGTTLREIKKDLISNNITGGKTHVELDFVLESPKGKNNYKIVRTLNPNKMFVYKDDVDKTRDSIANTTKYICEVLSASPAVFQNCVIMSVNNAIPFMAKNKVEKRKFIEDIFGLEVFSEMVSKVRQEYNDIKRTHDVQVSKLQEIITALNNYIQQRDKTLTRRDEKKALYLERQKANAEELTSLNKKITSIVIAEEVDVEERLRALDKTLCDCEDKIVDVQEKSSTKKATVSHKKEIYKKIGTSEETCPVCLRSINDHDQQNIIEEKNKLKQDIEALVGDIRLLIEKVTKLKDIKEKIKRNIHEKNQELNNIRLVKQDMQTTRERIKQLTQWQNDLEKDLQGVLDQNTEFDDIINETEERKREVETEVAEINKRISQLDIIKFIISEEGVKSYIVNKLLNLLNSRLQYYLKKLDSNSTCIFNEYFEEEIVNDKNKVCSYFNFSGAERKAIDLACLFAFSDMRRLQGGVSYNIAIYDELFDSSFDEKGIELIADILKERVSNFGECSIVVSHRKESIKNIDGSVIFLEKENGITRRVDFSE